MDDLLLELAHDLLLELAHCLKCSTQCAELDLGWRYSRGSVSETDQHLEVVLV